MKQVGVTSGGTLLVELTVTEAKQIQESLAVFVKLSAFPGRNQRRNPFRRRWPRPVSPTKHGQSGSHNKSGIIRTTPVPSIAAKGKNYCEDCKKVEISGRAKVCHSCAKIRARKWAAAHYRKTHPGCKPRPIIKSAVNIPSPRATSHEDRIDLIRQAADRVNRMREEAAG